MTSSIDFRNAALYSAPSSNLSRRNSVSAENTDSARANEPQATDTVTISDAARNKLSGARSDWKEKIIAEAKTNPKAVDSYLDAATKCTINGPLVDISDPPKIKLSSTGEIWTPEKQKTYEAASKGVMQNRRDIYTSESAKGAAPVEILAKIFAYNDSLPQWYKDGMNWS